MIFKIYENCKIVSGITESAIFDLIEGTYTILPLDYGKLLQGNSFSKDEIVKYEMEPFFNNLIDLGFGEYNNYQDILPPLSNEFIPHGKLTNAILEVSPEMEFDIFNVLDQLASFGCKAIEFIFIGIWTARNFDEFFNRLKDSRFTYFNVIVNDSEISLNDQKSITNKFRRIKRFKQSEKEDQSSMTPEDINLNVPSRNKININIRVFLESQNYSAAFNGKISIDSDGNIRNYKHHKLVFGNINDVEISNLLSNFEFLLQWNIKNDEIEKCKHCQFRYVCIDFSHVIKTNGNFSKLEECSFDPYKQFES